MQTLGKTLSALCRWQRVEIGHAVIVVFAMALGGCAGVSAEGARLRHAVRQGWQSGKGITIYAIHPKEFPEGSNFTAIRDTEPSSESAQLLRDQVLTDVTIAKTVNQFGLPAAIGFASSGAGQMQRFAMFYKTPPRSLVLQRSSMDVQWLSLSQLYESTVVADLPTVPRSVQRLALNEGPIAPPWPVTIPPDLREAFAVPQPTDPPAEVDGRDYITVADDLEARFPHLAGARSQERAATALAKLAAVARA